MKIKAFEPIQSPKKSILTKIKKFLIAILLICIRLPIFLSLLTFLIIYHTILIHFIYFETIKRVITLVMNLLVCRIILLCFGIVFIQSQFNLFSKETKFQIPKMKSGFIVLSNHTSFLDIFYLSYIMSPTFLKIYYKKTASSEIDGYFFSPLTFIETLKFAFSRSYQIPRNISDTKYNHRKLQLLKVIQECFDFRLGPALIFFEGATTNGSKLLNIDPDLLNIFRLVQIQYHRQTVFLKIKFENLDYSPVNPLGNQIFHLIRLMGNFTNNLIVTYKVLNYEPGNKEVYLEEIKKFYGEENQNEINEENVDWKDYKNLIDPDADDSKIFIEKKKKKKE